jgi:hypothetical protein
MKEAWRAEPRPVARAGKTGKLVDGLLNNSLVFYLIAFAAQRTWVVLNYDVLYLVRRIH